MSAPVQNNSNASDPEFYAPQRGREASAAPPQRPRAGDSGPAEAEAGAADGQHGQESTPPRPEVRPSARLPRGLGGPNIPLPVISTRVRRTAPRPPRATASVETDRPAEQAKPAEFEFEGAKLRYDLPLSLGPEVPSEPLLGRQSFRWFTTVAVAAAIVAGAVTFVSLPENRASIFKREMGPAVRQLFAGMPSSPQPTPRLIVEGRRTFANEALPLGVALKGASGSESAFLTGLVSGTRVSVGGPFGTNGWRIPVRELDGALAYAPKDFVGVMDAAIDLRLPNDLLVDSQALRLEWIVPKQSEVRARADQPQEAKTGAKTGAKTEAKTEARAEAKPEMKVAVLRTLDAAEVDLYVKRGRDYLSIGDVVSARLVLRRAANAGNAQAALMLGGSFDPNVLSELGVLGFAPDLAQARAWYQRAVELGSAEAPRHIERLAKAGN